MTTKEDSRDFRPIKRVIISYPGYKSYATFRIPQEEEIMKYWIAQHVESGCGEILISDGFWTK